MTNHLSPELQAVHDRFMVNYANGGIPAVEQMVEDMAVEAEAASAFSDGAQDAKHDVIMAQDTTDTSRIIETVTAAHEVTMDSISARSHHSFASFLLGVVKDQQ